MTDISATPRFLALGNHIHENLFQVQTCIGGFYSWSVAFNGEFHLHQTKKGRLEEWDIIFLGMSRPELEGVMASQIRKEIGWETKTKLVICIDYAIELWQGTFNPHALEQELMQADMLFVAEPMMLQHVRSLINDRKPVHHILHPSNINNIRRYSKPYEMRTDEIAAIIHRYDNNWLDPYLVIKDLPWDTHAVLLDPGIQVHLYAYYKFFKEGHEFTQYLDWVSRKKVILDSYHRIHTYGRTPVDNACLGIPTVGADWTYSQKLLWPELTVQCGDTWGQTQMIKKLFEDRTFYDDCVEKAAEIVETYSYENRKQDLLNKLYN